MPPVASRPEIERRAAALGQLLNGRMPRNCGFCLLMFEHGDEPDRFTTYISNTARAAAVAMLREQADALEAAGDDRAREGG